MFSKPEIYPSANKGTVIVWGLLASMPFGGMIWQVLHHLVGLRRLGFDVWYVEDSHNSCMHPETWEITWNFDDTTRFLENTMKSIGLDNRWVFRPPKHPDYCVGARDHRGLQDLYKESDIVFNLCGAQSLRPEHDEISCLVLLQTDPVASQLKADMGNSAMIQFLSRHDYLFTYAENLGKPFCKLPSAGFHWLPTRPPVIVDWWESMNNRVKNGRLTTVANLANKRFNINWKGKDYSWEKHVEYKNLIELPTRSALPLEIAAVGWSSGMWEQMSDNGWITRTARNLSRADDYHNYITHSLGEFSVAKEQNIYFRSGWFSDRSACYLAAGNPVITQDTGFSHIIPVGRGLFSYNTIDEAVAAIDNLARNPREHQLKASELAREYFSADKVLSEILSIIGLL